MRWYVGGIAEAVATSKTRNAIFVVYVEGKDDKSKTLTLYINEYEVSSKLESSNFVALKLEAGSTHHNQFAEIYKNVPVPSMFFIGKAGQPLDIVTEVKSSTELAERIEKVLLAHEGVAVAKKQSTAAQSTLLISQRTSTGDSTQMTASTSQTLNTVAAVIENGVCHKPEESKEESETASANVTDKDSEIKDIVIDKSTEEKMQRAMELVEKKRLEKKQEEEEKLKLQEIERRKLGQEVQKLKEWQKDQEIKELMEKRKKEKSEDKATRDRILAQIAQDRMDSNARFSKSPPNSSLTSELPKPDSKQNVQSNSARLQFRLPDGKSDTNTFQNNTTLQEIRNYITENLHPPFRNFGLATTFPRREFTSDDSTSTLLELELCPNAVILVIPGTAQIPLSRQEGGVSGMLYLLFSQLYGVYAYFRNWVFGAPPTVGRPEQGAGTQSENKRAGENTEQQSSSKRRVTDSTTVRREGNVHRLTDRSDSDDENNTWNGNSTQQM